jgi:hypothetical protein
VLRVLAARKHFYRQVMQQFRRKLSTPINLCSEHPIYVYQPVKTENANIKKSSNINVICNAYYICFIKILGKPVSSKSITNEK